ncbi:MAG TPA: hypothetical protein VLE97_05715 [Gaiellaceae bacterium]|nr:hypothetical protein [Gaiellaceae bacterium]
MAHITEEHLHHMARRHHATMKKLDGIRERMAGITGRFIGTLEVGVGSWVGGALEGRTSGGTFLKVPYNLGIGVVLLALGHGVGQTDAGGAGYSEHFNNLGNGFLGSYLAATGFAWGRKWKETGKMFGHHSWSQAYGGEMGPPPPAVHGDLSEAQMASIVQRMQQAAAAPAH